MLSSAQMGWHFSKIKTDAHQNLYDELNGKGERYMRKRLLGLLLVLAMILSLAACSSTDTSKTEQTTAPAETTETTTPAQETEAGGKTLKIGLVAAVTGTEPLEGERMVQGLELALDEYNAAGKVNDITIEFEIQDSQGTPDGMVNAAPEVFACNGNRRYSRRGEGSLYCRRYQPEAQGCV